jgi:hypothetical protein
MAQNLYYQKQLQIHILTHLISLRLLKQSLLPLHHQIPFQVALKIAALPHYNATHTINWQWWKTANVANDNDSGIIRHCNRLLSLKLPFCFFWRIRAGKIWMVWKGLGSPAPKTTKIDI